MPLFPSAASAAPDQTDAMWCVVGNIVEERPFGPRGEELRRGTKHFSPGTKIYCFPRRYGVYSHDLGQQIEVLGKHRGRRGGLVKMIINVKWITNWRSHVVYSPLVLRLFREDGYENEHWPPWTENTATAYVARMQAYERAREEQSGDSAPAE